MLKKVSIIAGIILILLGIFLIADPYTSAFTLGWLLGLLLALAGLNICIFGFNTNPKPVLAIILGILILICGLGILFDSVGNYQLMAFNTVVTIANIFLLVGGVSRIIEAFQTKAFNPTWGLTLALGILTVVVAIALLSDPVVGMLAREIILAINCIFQGILLLTVGGSMPKEM